MSIEDSDNVKFSIAEEAAQRAKVEAVVLPTWLSDNLPDHLPKSVISFKGGKFHVSHDGSEHDTINEAYDYLRTLKDGYQLVLDESVNGQGGELTGAFFHCDPEEGKTTTRLLMSYPTEERLYAMKEDYLRWLDEIVVQYESNPNDFLNSHNFLSYHPAFWVRDKNEKTFNWEMDFGLDKLAINVWADEETGLPVVFLEHGLHVEPEYIRHYHDDRIFSRSDTYEGAIVVMARRVHKTYDVDGVERTEQ